MINIDGDLPRFTKIVPGFFKGLNGKEKSLNIAIQDQKYVTEIQAGAFDELEVQNL